MLNNGHGGTPDGGHQGGHAMYNQGGGHPGSVEYKYDPPKGPVDYKYGDPNKGGGGMEYKYDPSQHPNNYLSGGPSPPGGMNGMGGGAHHSGGYCSQMTLNQSNQCPPNKIACSGCRLPIMERFLFKCLDQFWHHSCLKCAQCYATLADVGNSCFTRDGMILCRNDYLKIFGSGGLCHGCGQGIPPSELVMRAGVSPPGSSPPLVYHMQCFVCSKCNCRLQPGDRYSVLNGALFCEQDALKLMKNGIGSPSNAHVPNTNGPTVPPKKGKVGRPRRSRD